MKLFKLTNLQCCDCCEFLGIQFLIITTGSELLLPFTSLFQSLLYFRVSLFTIFFLTQVWNTTSFPRFHQIHSSNNYYVQKTLLKVWVKEEVYTPITYIIKTIQDHESVQQQHFFHQIPAQNMFPDSSFLFQTLSLESLSFIQKDLCMCFSKQKCIFSGS